MNTHSRNIITQKVKSIFLKEEDTNMSSLGEEVPDNYEDIIKTFDNMEAFVKDEKTRSDNDLKNAMRLSSTLKDPAQKTVANNNIRVQKERMKKLDLMNKTVEDQKKSVEDSFKNKQTAPQTQTQISTSISEIAPPIAPSVAPLQTGDIQPVKKAFTVKFDTKTDRPFTVNFTERGFAVEDTRLSFETLENALSKNYSITLQNGRGLVLDALKMQKILKYKDKTY
jgi:hypothetical protein